MYDAKDVLFVLLAVVTVFYLWRIFKAAREAHPDVLVRPTPLQGSVGFVTAFFDTLGIGSFATTTTIFKLKKMVDVREIPGTLNVGHTLPTITEAFIYTRIVPVDSRTLVLMIVASVVGAWLGAGVVTRWPRRKIQIGMGLALLAAAVLMLASQLQMLPVGGQTLSLSGTRLAVGLAGNFALGALMMLGIGLYAPCMILVSLLGMNPIAAFPIMMGSCAFLMPISSARFIREKSFNLQATLGLAIGAVPGVLIAAFIVRSLPLSAVRWLVVVVVVYTGLNMLLTARTRRAAAQAGVAAPPSATPVP
ncbi:MAG TPA: sulfite exporter TauE/SafE family protein [Vicinamibacterales bacterium]|nr:sulfite exporter TauE/SafE family protein [Vicinamibacterales bacterium]